MTVLSLLQDPTGKGGTATVVRWYRTWMDANRAGERTEYMLDEAAPGTLRRFVEWSPDVPRVPRLLPRLHAPSYVAGAALLRNRLTDDDEVHVVGASALHGSLAGRRPADVVWLGTTLTDERRADITRRRSLGRRILYRSTMPFLTRIERQVLHRARRLLAISSHTADRLVAEGADPRRVEVVHVPVDTEQYHPPTNADGRRGALFVGRANDPRKGFDRIEALLVGSDILRCHGVDVVSAAGPRATPGVRPLGIVADLPKVYRSAEVLLLPSRQEGLGIVVLEALACSTPVVAYRCGGPDRLLEESGGGIVVDDAAGFHQAVETVLKDHGRRAHMGAAGRAWVEEHASAQAFLSDSTTFAG